MNDIHDEILDKLCLEKELLRQKKNLKKEKSTKDSEIALKAVSEFLDKNPNVNIGFVIHHLQSKVMRTIEVCRKLGISPTSFARLRKKYNIESVYEAKNTTKDTPPQSPTTFKNYFFALY